MTDTDLLREAAQVVRKTAQAATPDVCPDWTGLAVRHVARNCDLECPTHEDRYECQQWSRYDDAPHIALWRPRVADDITDLLDCAANMDPSERETVAREQCGWCGRDHLTEIARALLAKEA